MTTPDVKTPRDLLTTTLGAIAFENDFTVVRAKTIRNTYGNWRTQITIHRRKGDMEQVPLGYVRGENILWLDE